MKRRLLGFCFLLTVCMGNLQSLTSAHVLEADKSIGAVLHIDPDDDPVAGSVSTFYFDFQDKTGRFSLANCDCTISVLSGQTQLTKKPLTVNGDKTGSAQFRFPARDVYTVTVDGRSESTAAPFQTFALHFDIRVERGTGAAAKKQPTPLKASYLAGLAASGVFLFALCYTLLTKVRVNNGK